MNEKYNEYLKDLPPELQEKAKNIKTREELLEFLSDNDVELPEDALDAVAGGSGCGSDKCEHESVSEQESFEGQNVEINRWGFFRRVYCPFCGSTMYQFRRGDGANYDYFDISRETYDQSRARVKAEEGKAAVYHFAYAMKAKGRF